MATRLVICGMILFWAIFLLVYIGSNYELDALIPAIMVFLFGGLFALALFGLGIFNGL